MFGGKIQGRTVVDVNPSSSRPFNSKQRGDQMSQVDLAATAPTQFQNIGGVSLAFRRFGKEGAPPVVCFQHGDG